MRLDTGEAQEGQLNLMPLIDVVFLLLVFFLAATTFAKEEVEMNLVLPEAQSGEPQGNGQTIVINVASDGRLTVDGREVNLEALRQKLKAAAARNQKQEVLIRGDTRVRFGLVAQALDACILAKLTHIAVAAQPEGSGN